ncbi:hypothetical protein LY78DRAFT_288802 [Colletotrichum sublineola]|nr:hypothetical protein LY78DRAFT_288802 [Colletotrichum sublineola]
MTPARASSGPGRLQGHRPSRPLSLCSTRKRAGWSITTSSADLPMGLNKVGLPRGCTKVYTCSRPVCGWLSALVSLLHVRSWNHFVMVHGRIQAQVPIPSVTSGSVQYSRCPRVCLQRETVSQSVPTKPLSFLGA